MAPMVVERFTLAPETVRLLHSMEPKFGFDGLGEFVYYRTYSRVKDNGQQETWADTVVRVVEGIFSIRKDHLLKHYLPWNEKEMQTYAKEFSLYFFDMKFLPPGRGLWACGTQFMYERGSAALNNCGACTTKDLTQAVWWTMDALMNGIGIGFDTIWKPVTTYTKPLDKSDKYTYVIPDSREGWVESVRLLVDFYEHQRPTFPVFDYSLIRGPGLPIKGFGGTSSGPECLKKLHARIEAFFDCYIRCTISHHEVDNDHVKTMIDELSAKGTMDTWENPEQLKATTKTNLYDEVRLITDIMNSVGATVIAGSVRRSAMIALGEPTGSFRDLKNYEKCPERGSIGWMSNNSVVLKCTEDFNNLPQIAENIRVNGEPGFINLLNVKRWGRVGRHLPEDRNEWTREQEEDEATLVNPCGEIPLKSFSLCCLSECFPTRCLDPETNKFDAQIFMKALEFATFYATTVTLLPTHWTITNEVLAQHRRIGVSLSGIADWYHMISYTEMTRYLRDGYKVVRSTNTKLSKEAGVPPAIRVTTVKPSGSISLLAGVSPGLHYPTHRYCVRRVRVGEFTPICKVLIESGMPYEKDISSDNTLIFSFPIDQSHSRAATEVSMFEQSNMLAMLQSEYADNSVSITIYFNPKTESHDLEHLLAFIAPRVKSCSMLPHSEDGVYAQAPLTGIDKETYEKMKASHPKINWALFGNSDGMLEKFCDSDVCTR